MFTMPLKKMKLRTKELESAYGASYGRVRVWNATTHHHTKFHQGWDLEAATGTPCYAVCDGVVTHVGHHPQFGWNVVLQFSGSGSPVPGAAYEVVYILVGCHMQAAGSADRRRGRRLENTESLRGARNSC